jgi:hypothetical protein
MTDRMKRTYADEMGLPVPGDTLRLGIGFLEIGTRTKNALHKAGIVDVQQCIDALKRELKIPGMAKVCSNELRDAINALYEGLYYGRVF